MLVSFSVYDIVWGCSRFEYAVRRLPVEKRKTIDLSVKNFVSAVLQQRHLAYEAGELDWNSKIGKDSEAGKGFHAGLYKQLMRNRKYDLEWRDEQVMQEYKRRKVDDAEDYVL